MYMYFLPFQCQIFQNTKSVVLWIIVYFKNSQCGNSGHVGLEEILMLIKQVSQIFVLAEFNLSTIRFSTPVSCTFRPKKKKRKETIFCSSSMDLPQFYCLPKKCVFFFVFLFFVWFFFPLSFGLFGGVKKV